MNNAAVQVTLREITAETVGAVLDLLTAEKQRVLPTFTFRTFSRKANGNPKVVTVAGGKIAVNGALKPTPGLSEL